MQQMAVPTTAPNGRKAQAEPKKTTLAFSHFRKTRMCGHFQWGHCAYGASCDFAHNQLELQERVDLAKTSLCKDFLRGVCPHPARSCAFAHGKGDLRRVMPESAPLKEGRSTKERRGRKKVAAEPGPGQAKEAHEVVGTVEVTGVCLVDFVPPLPLKSQVEDTPKDVLPPNVYTDTPSSTASYFSSSPFLEGKTNTVPFTRGAHPSEMPAFIWQGRMILGGLEDMDEDLETPRSIDVDSFLRGEATSL